MKKLKKQTLEKIYNENQTYKAAEILKLSVPTLMVYLKKAGIPTKRERRFKASRFEIID